MAQCTCGLPDISSANIHFGMSAKELPGAMECIVAYNPNRNDTTLFVSPNGLLVQNGDTFGVTVHRAFFDSWYSGAYPYEGQTRAVIFNKECPGALLAFDFYHDRLFAVQVFGAGVGLVGQLNRRLVSVERSNEVRSLNYFFRPFELPMVRSNDHAELIRGEWTESKAGPIAFHFMRKEYSEEFWLEMMDRKALQRMPSFCGNANVQSGNTWLGFGRYLSKLELKAKRRAR